MNLLEAILKTQNGGAVSQLASQFGLQQNQAQDALQSLLPALSSGLKRNVQRDGGTESLLAALGRGNHQRFMDDPTQLARSGARDEGNNILAHLLGSKDVSRAVADRAAVSSGLGSDLLKKMLPVIASLVMGSLAKNSAGSSSPLGGLLKGMMGGGGAGGAGAGGLADVLGGLLGGSSGGGGRQAQSSGGGGLGGMLGDLLGGGQQQQSTSGRPLDRTARSGSPLDMFGSLLDADQDGSNMDDIFELLKRR